MGTEPLGRPTSRLDERDEELAEKLGRILRQSDLLKTEDASSINDTLDYCLARTRLVRMGGRSAPLVAASVIVWGTPAARLRFDLEGAFGVALAVASDPSFVWPEWGVILAGVLVARFSVLVDNFRESPARAQDELLAQVRLRLTHFVKGTPPASQSRVIEVARATLYEWERHFPDGLVPVVKIAQEMWPQPSTVSSAELTRRMEVLDTTMPAWYSEEDLSIYRAELEGSGNWVIALPTFTRASCGDPAALP